MGVDIGVDMVVGVGMSIRVDTFGMVWCRMALAWGQALVLVSVYERKNYTMFLHVFDGVAFKYPNFIRSVHHPFRRALLSDGFNAWILPVTCTMRHLDETLSLNQQRFSHDILCK